MFECLFKFSIFMYYFNIMFSYFAACGKTTFVKDILLHHNTRIQPQIQRIVWLYKRWQPMYTIIKSTVMPKVEFIQGIPQELDDDDYFGPRQNNLLILDDMMSTAGKDKRITDLFTEGSHHRSLSIISINQNLYATKDPTQRRNCQYMILYDNPVDKSMTFALARQMFPNNTDKFMKCFEKATKRPYGFLLLDLKSFTPANQRLRYDIMWKDKYPEPIKDVHHDLIGHFPAQSSLGADILVYWIGKIVRTCAPGGSRTLDSLRARRAPYPLGQALRSKIVVSEWRSVIAVSLNVGGGVRLIKPAKLCMCTQNTTNTTKTDARRRVCAAMVPYR